MAAIAGAGKLVGRMILQAPDDVLATATTLFDLMAAKLANSDWAAG
ncbi:hypothetical protein ACQP1O_16545 [Nocardia sp. CA-151230]